MATRVAKGERVRCWCWRRYAGMGDDCPECNSQLAHRREIASAVEAGASYANVAKSYGISRQRVHQIVNRANGV